MSGMNSSQRDEVMRQVQQQVQMQQLQDIIQVLFLIFRIVSLTFDSAPRTRASRSVLASPALLWTTLRRYQCAHFVVLNVLSGMHR